MRLMSPLISRLLSVGILGALIVLTYFAAVRPVHSLFAAKIATIEQLEATVARYQRVEAMSDVYRARLEEVRGSPLPDIVYRAPSPELLTTRLQNDARSLIRDAGGRIDSMQTIRPSLDDSRYTLGSRMSMQCEVGVLLAVLESFNRHDKLLTLDNISLRTSDLEIGSEAPLISVRWDLIAYGELGETRDSS